MAATACGGVVVVVVGGAVGTVVVEGGGAATFFGSGSDPPETTTKPRTATMTIATAAAIPMRIRFRRLLARRSARELGVVGSAMGDQTTEPSTCPETRQLTAGSCSSAARSIRRRSRRK